MKLYTIDVTNSRSAKTYAYPSIERQNDILPDAIDGRFASAEAAADAICDRLANWILLRAIDQAESLGIEDDHAQELAINRLVDECKNKIRRNGCISFDGIEYRMRESDEDYGQLFVGIEDGDHLINLEPIDDRLGIADLFTEHEAEGILDDYVCFNVVGKYTLTREPYGWTATWTDEDGEEQVSHFAWKAEPTR